MKNEQNRQYLSEVYSDVLGEQPDPKSLRLVSYLHAAFGDNKPPAYLAQSLDQMLGECSQERRKEAHRTSWSGRFLQFFPLPSRISVATTLLLMVFVLVGAGYEVLPALERLFTVHIGTGAIISSQLGKEMNVSRMVDGFTVTIRRVYADPNQVVIGIFVSGPPGRTFNHIIPWGNYYETPKSSMGEMPILTDKGGREFNGGIGGEQGGMEGGSAPYLLTYEGIGIKGDMKEISVRLKIGELTAYERLGENKYEDVSVKGPFTFDLTIPVEQGRAADLGQTAQSEGTSVTLERVVTTATGTRLSLRGAGPNADVRLTVGGETYNLHLPDGMATPMRWTADSTWEYISGVSLQDKHGEWVLTVMPGPPVPSHVDPSPTQLKGGPWTFHFIVP